MHEVLGSIPNTTKRNLKIVGDVLSGRTLV
jgi:hypothetical protein